MTVIRYAGFAVLLGSMAWQGYAQQPDVATERSASPATADAVLRTRRVTLELHRVSLRQAVDAIAARGGVQVQYQLEMVEAYRMPVSIHAQDVPLGSVFDQALFGTHFRIVPVTATRLVLVDTHEAHGSAVASGTIGGVVTDAKTKRPIAAATVSLDGESGGMNSDENGRFRFVGVSAGTHKVQVKRIGYIRQTRSVTVDDGAILQADFQLEPSASVLDQVVVTGTIIPTELKAVPNAITVITAKDIEQRGITHIDQLFRGAIPGLFASNQGDGAAGNPGFVMEASRGSTMLPNVANAALNQPIKTYVDGVELADPSFIGLIDPRSIERIEILTGPQASTIYGSNAINGVIQIFTKRGTTTRPQITATLVSGLIQNNYSTALAPQHNDAVQLAGVEGHMSYNFGGAWRYTGAWSPSVHQATVSGSGGVRLQQGPVTADVSSHRTQAANRDESANALGQATLGANGTYATIAGGGSGLRRVTNTNNALGMTLTYTPVSWWSQGVTAGTDGVDQLAVSNPVRWSNPGDTLASFDALRESKLSLSYNTTVQIPLGPASLVTVGGVDGWHALSTTQSAQPAALTGTLDGASITRQPSHDRGMFLQTQLAVWNALFVTYGLRSEWNPTYGTAVNPNIVSRYGIAYTRDIGLVTAKVRASYGHSTRPPVVGQSSQMSGNICCFGGVTGPYVLQLANPELVPEQQQGGEGGLELYIGNHGSLTVTRYNQTVDQLIGTVPSADSVDTGISLSGVGEDPLQYPYWTNGDVWWPQAKNLNVGSIRNQGWELQGSGTFGPLTSKATYSWNKSRLIGITPKYAPILSRQYVVGSPFQMVPEHTWALDVIYANATTSVSMDVQGQGFMIKRTGLSAFGTLVQFGRLRTQLPRLSIPRSYVELSPGYALADLNASHRFSSTIEGLVQIQNLANVYRQDQSSWSAATGRVASMGIRVRY